MGLPWRYGGEAIEGEGGELGLQARLTRAETQKFKTECFRDPRLFYFFPTPDDDSNEELTEAEKEYDSAVDLCCESLDKILRHLKSAGGFGEFEPGDEERPKLSYSLVREEVSRWTNSMSRVKTIVEREQGWVGYGEAERKKREDIEGRADVKGEEDMDVDSDDDDANARRNNLTPPPPTSTPNGVPVHRYAPLVFPSQAKSSPVANLPKWSKFVLQLTFLEHTLKKGLHKTSENVFSKARKTWVGIASLVVASISAGSGSEEGVKRRRDLVERVWRAGIQLSGGGMSDIKIGNQSEDNKSRIALEMKLAELSYWTGFSEKNTVTT